jgi:hypothetical protein
MNESDELKKSDYGTTVVATNKRTLRRNTFFDRVQKEAAKPIVLRELIERLIKGDYIPDLVPRSAKNRERVIREKTRHAYTHKDLGYLKEGTISVSFDEDDDLINQIRKNKSIPETEKQQLIMSRRGQGRFRAELERIEAGCRVTRVRDRAHLRASHIKPWQRSTNEERA